MTLKHRPTVEDDMSFKGSPQLLAVSSARLNHADLVFNTRSDHQSGSTEVNEQLKTKEEEIKILWNVIKEINKNKGSERVSMEQL